MQLIDLAVFKEQVDRIASPEAQVLREITLQTEEATAAVTDSPEAEAAKLCTTINERIATKKSDLRSEAERLAVEKSAQRKAPSAGGKERQIMKELRLQEHTEEMDSLDQEITSSQPGSGNGM